jgi:hypothetical protein
MTLLESGTIKLCVLNIIWFERLLASLWLCRSLLAFAFDLASPAIFQERGVRRE